MRHAEPKPAWTCMATDLDFFVDVVVSGAVLGVGLIDSPDGVAHAIGTDFVEDCGRAVMRRDYGLVEFFGRVGPDPIPGMRQASPYKCTAWRPSKSPGASSSGTGRSVGTWGSRGTTIRQFPNGTTNTVIAMQDTRNRLRSAEHLQRSSGPKRTC